MVNTITSAEITRQPKINEME